MSEPYTGLGNANDHDQERARNASRKDMAVGNLRTITIKYDEPQHSQLENQSSRSSSYENIAASSNTPSENKHGDVRRLILLKNRAEPQDPYQTLLETTFDNVKTEFIPVLDYINDVPAIEWLAERLRNGSFSMPNQDENKSYSGIIITSQRAVVALSHALSLIHSTSRSSILEKSFPIYVVGSATANAVRQLGLSCEILGENSGTSEVLAKFIISQRSPSPYRDYKPLLSLAGEIRRDALPQMLKQSGILLEEKVVYRTTVRANFAEHLRRTLLDGKLRAGVMWIVVFSPAACRIVLETLGWLNDAGKFDSARILQSRRGKVFIATIGPTTKKCFKDEYGFEVQACASISTPEAIVHTIQCYNY